MRGLFTAGVIDTFLEQNIKIDAIIGVSAGALFGANYYSKQIGRAIRYNKKYCKDIRYISIASYLITGNIVNKNFAFYKLNNSIDKFDDETFKKSKGDFFVTVTNVETGLPEYIKISSCLEELELLRATSSIPLVSKIVDYNGSKYLDGAISDSIPVKKALEMGYDKVIVVLTRPLNYKKEQYNEKILNRIKKEYKEYPKFIEAMENRYKMYNNETKYIKELEKNNRIFVIRPSRDLDVKVVERNRDKLQKVYDLGKDESSNCMDKLKEFIH